MSGLYVALGDSMSIDAYAGGPGRGAASLLHRNRDIDFPDWVGRDLSSAAMSAQILASDGAMSADVLHEQLPLIESRPTLVTITMGGNDLMVAYGDTDSAYAALERVIGVGGDILTRLRAAGAGTIVLTTVYDPSDGSGQIPTAALPPWPQGPVVLAALNTALAGLARRFDAVLADVHGAFAGHGVTVGDPGQPDPRPADRDLWYCGIIEPNAWGAHAIRATWWHSLHQEGALPDTSR